MTYYVKAHTTNIADTAYGPEKIFTAYYGEGEAYQGGIIAYIAVPCDADYMP